MDKNAIQKFKDALAKSTNVGIAVGQNPSIDEMGAALAVYLLLRTANKKVSIAAPSDPIVEISSLIGINKVQKNFGGDSGDLTVSFPYKEGEIEKVSYTLENNFLNIIVKASEKGLTFDPQDVKYSHGSGNIDLLIVVGASQLSDIGNVIDSQKLANISIVNIDNDPANHGFGDVVMLSPGASSVCEHVGDIALILGFAIDQDASQNLLSGIISATNNFQNPKTSPLAFEIASIVMKSGALRSKAQTDPRPAQFSTAAPVSNNAISMNPIPAPAQKNSPFQPKPAAPVQTQPMQQPFQQPKQQTYSPAAPEFTERTEKPEDQNEKAPLDWLTPKVYKGSSEV